MKTNIRDFRIHEGDALTFITYVNESKCLHIQCGCCERKIKGNVQLFTREINAMVDLSLQVEKERWKLVKYNQGSCGHKELWCLSCVERQVAQVGREAEDRLLGRLGDVLVELKELDHIIDISSIPSYSVSVAIDNIARCIDGLTHMKNKKLEVKQ